MLWPGMSVSPKLEGGVSGGWAGADVKPSGLDDSKPPSGFDMKPPAGFDMKPPSGYDGKPPAGYDVKPPAGFDLKLGMLSPTTGAATPSAAAGRDGGAVGMGMGMGGGGGGQFHGQDPVLHPNAQMTPYVARLASGEGRGG